MRGGCQANASSADHTQQAQAECGPFERWFAHDSAPFILHLLSAHRLCAMVRCSFLNGSSLSLVWSGLCHLLSTDTAHAVQRSAHLHATSAASQERRHKRRHATLLLPAPLSGTRVVPAGDERAAVAGYACQPALCSGNAATQASSTARSPGGEALAPRYGAYSERDGDFFGDFWGSGKRGQA